MDSFDWMELGGCKWNHNNTPEFMQKTRPATHLTELEDLRAIVKIRLQHCPIRAVA